MVKRVSCRVISSVPLSKTRAGSLSVIQQNDRQDEIGNTGNTAVKPITIFNPVENIDILSITSGALDYTPGQFIDYYA
jgi:hypothetical protein